MAADTSEDRIKSDEDPFNGRLFTLADMEAVALHLRLGAPSVTAAIAVLDDGILSWLPDAPRKGFAFPREEPVFVLRGSDGAAHLALWIYAFTRGELGLSTQDEVTSLLGRANDMREWGEENLGFSPPPPPDMTGDEVGGSI